MLCFTFNVYYENESSGPSIEQKPDIEQVDDNDSDQVVLGDEVHPMKEDEHKSEDTPLGDEKSERYFGEEDEHTNQEPHE